MITYQICVEYLGTNFVGWQLQKNGLSIQEVLEKVISNFLKNKTRITRGWLSRKNYKFQRN